MNFQSESLQTEVVVIGAGPVGLTMAIDLAGRGIDVTVVEQNPEEVSGDAKCNTIGARTMEIFRRLGVAADVRAAGLADDFPTDVIYTTAITGEELTRLAFPSRSGRFAENGRTAPGYLDSHWLTPEPYCRVSQIYLNPILQNAALSRGNVRVLFETRFLEFEETEGGIRTRVEKRNGEEVIIDAAFLIGCDGGSSAVRRQLGVRLAGNAELAHTRTTLVRTPELIKLFPQEPAWMSWVLNTRITGNVIAIDGKELWMIHRSLTQGMNTFEDLDLEQSIRDVLGVDKSFKWQQVSHQDWTGRRLIARKICHGRVFIVGDAAHLWIPYAGYGMNTGIADGHNLAWKLAAVLRNQAGDAVLDTHEVERRPVMERTSRLAMGKALEYAEATSRKKVRAVLEAEGAAGVAARKEFGEELFAINAGQFASEGLNFGYAYEASPIIAYDGEQAPDYDMATATASTVPGSQLPHFWVDGRSVFDLLGDGYTLLQFGDQVPGDDTAGMLSAFADAGIPLAHVRVPVQPAPFGSLLILVRPDQHIAWRGDRVPAAAQLAARVAGRLQPAVCT